MTTWPDIARDSLEAAKLLRDAGHHRSAVSRAYYAALYVLASRLPLDRVPRHNDVRGLIDRHLDEWPAWRRRKLRTAFNRMRRRREDADYDRRTVTNAGDSQEVLDLASSVLKEFAVEEN